ncbi:MAG: DUF2314 domain-containing protein [Sphingomonadaceae bacterium]|nr:DUF2314 domain-containing protein [Sphingomonadaceae bacterium]
MRRALLAALLLAWPALQLAAQDNNNTPGREHDPITMVEAQDPEMNAAIAQAQATLPEWLALLADPPEGSGGFAFKFPLEGFEHIWVGGVTRNGDVLSGRLANVPMLEGWQQGDRVEVPLSEVSDWAWWDADGKAHGYRTVAVLMQRMPPAQAEQLRRGFGWEE